MRTRPDTLRLRLFLAGVFALASLGATANAQTDDFVDEWFDNSIRSGGVSYQGEQRGYLTGGSFSGRFRMSNDSLFTVTPPRINASCGGIDLFAGGISYLDPEYLVQKLENILQAAPAVAFSLALEHICAPCDDAIKELERIAAEINAVALNDCQAANKVARIVMPEALIGEEAKMTVSDLRLSSGQSKNATHVQEEVAAAGDAAPAGTNLRQVIDGCPTRVTDLLASGSLVGHAAANANLGDFEDLIRGMVGDVATYWDPGMPDVLPVFEPVTPCERNEPGDLTALVIGGVFMKDRAQVCSQNNGEHLRDRVADLMIAIGAKFGSSTAFTTEEQDFMNEMSPLMVRTMLQEAAKTDTVGEVTANSASLVAVQYAYEITRDLLNEIEFMLAMADRDLSLQGRDPSNPTARCDLGLLASGVDELQEIRARIWAMEEAMKADLMLFLTEYNNVVAYQRAMLDNSRRARLMATDHTVEER